MLLINSSIFLEYLSDRYIEDFKYVSSVYIYSYKIVFFYRYFLKEDVILSRIPVQYPIYRFIPDLIRGVHHRILYGEPSINLSNRTKHRQLI
jgi:hypothetical protein